MPMELRWARRGLVVGANGGERLLEVAGGWQRAENCAVRQSCSAEGKHNMDVFGPSWGLLRWI